MKLIILFTSLLSFSAGASVDFIRCSMTATYELYKGDGFLGRGKGSLVSAPVEFTFFANDQEFSLLQTGPHGNLIIRGRAAGNSATVSFSGKSHSGSANFVGEGSFPVKSGWTKSFSQEEVAPMNYTDQGIRVAFTGAEVRCNSGRTPDQSPRLN